MKQCSKCKKLLPESKFWKKDKSGRLDTKCHSCAMKLHKLWRKKNKEKWINYNEKYIIKRKKRRLRLRFNIFQRDNFTCQYCGRKVPEITIEIDHLYPKSKGGLDKIENYATTCRDCNLGKGDSILNEFKK